MADLKTGITRLNGTNWSTWKIRVDALLAKEDLWDVIEEEIPAAAAQDDAWKSKDRKARGNIISLLEDNQLSLVKGRTHARDVYNALKDYHQKATRSVRVSVLKKFCAVNLEDGGDIELHLREFDELTDRLEGAGMNLDKDTKICMLLRSLPESYDGIVTALDCLSDDDINIDVIKSKLVDEYNRQRDRKGGALKVEKAMRSSVGKPQKKPKKCYNCGAVGHFKAGCPKLGDSQKSGQSSKSDTAGNAKAKAAHSDARGVAFTVGEEKPGCWVIDSGASAHMTNDRSFFKSLREFAGGYITLADGKKTQIRGEGSGVVYGIDGDEKVIEIDVGEVKFVPGLSTNLISVGKLAQLNYSVVFDQDSCSIVNAESEVIATGRRHGGLYYLRLAEHEKSMAAAEGQHKADCQHQWHRRLGHRDWAAAGRIVNEKLATGMQVSDCGLRLVCECCMEGKSARLPFPSVVDRKSSKILDIVHTDLCGPMRTTTPSGNRYYMTIIDDFSRFTVTYVLNNKFEAAGRIKEYVRWVENLFGRKPRVVRSDGGGEFNNKELRNFYKAEGIKPQFTTAYSPQSNGVAERKNRSLTEMATCMLIDAELDKRFWGEAILTATYLQNRMPSRTIESTPYELWWGRKPDLKHLRVFGSTAFVHVPDVKRGKMDSKARKLIFVGYAIEQKAYRFVDLETDQITVSRDARFIETGTGTSTLEMPESEAAEDIPLIPFVEKKEEPEEEVASEPDSDTSDNEEFHEAEGIEAESTPTVRRSGRSNLGARPRYLDDFELEQAVGMAACAVEEPVDHKKALKDHVWCKAMLEELGSHQHNGTWKLVQLPEGRKAIGLKWIYKVKRNEENQIVKFKARLVAQGFAQKTGIDVEDVFAPVTRQATFRTFLTVALKHGMTVRHLDIKTAYLYGELEEEVYMRQPPGFVVPGKENYVCRLQRSIYGLRQSARCWNKRLDTVLVKLGFKAATADPCLYVRHDGRAKVILMVYVDDLLIASKDEGEIGAICDGLKAEFELTSLGEVRHFLGVEVKREADVYKLSLRNYINKLLKEFGMEECKSAKTPMDPAYLKVTEAGEPFKDSTNYRSLVGGLLYLAVVARPDIAAAAAILGRRFSAPRECDWTAAKRVLRYLRGTKDYRLLLGGDRNLGLVGFSDADWAGDADSRRSTSGMVFQYGGGSITWASRRQPCVTLSSMESEYVALCESCQEAVWLRQLLRDFGEPLDKPTVIKEDNQGCLAFVRSERTSRRSKHIDTKQRFIQELCLRKEITLEYCPTDRMAADLMTKPLGPQKHREFSELLGLKEEM